MVKKVSYKFGEKVVGIPYKIVVVREDPLNKFFPKSTASIIVTPRTKNEPSIGRVILLNRESKNVNQATYSENLSAEARTTNLFGYEITFYLWEEAKTNSKFWKQ